MQLIENVLFVIIEGSKGALKGGSTIPPPEIFRFFLKVKEKR